ncbi:MAG: MerR family transcriptional regulator [Bacillota bacterium]
MEERYNIREVARLTGLTAATLRKWEERYDIVRPLRLPNGYREYTRSDLAVLLWVKAKVDGGALVSAAASELKERLEQGWIPNGDDLRQAQLDKAANLLEARREDLLTALLERDPARVTTALDGAFGALGLETVLIDVVQEVLYEIGRLWETGVISSFQEHYSTVLIRDRLLSLRSVVGPLSGPTFVTACLPGEQHELGALTLGLLAARHGFQVTHLGYSPSPDGLQRALLDLRPEVMGLSVATAVQLQQAEDWIRSMGRLAAAEAPGSLVVVGGYGVRERARWPEGIEFIPGSAREALAEIHLLLYRRSVGAH